VVHGNRAAVDAFWQRRTNFEEPMLLYHARRRGWVLPRDGFTIAALDACIAAAPASSSPSSRPKHRPTCLPGSRPAPRR
jgi:hypothetical protein